MVLVRIASLVAVLPVSSKGTKERFLPPCCPSLMLGDTGEPLADSLPNTNFTGSGSDATQPDVASFRRVMDDIMLVTDNLKSRATEVRQTKFYLQRYWKTSLFTLAEQRQSSPNISRNPMHMEGDQGPSCQPACLCLAPRQPVSKVGFSILS
jgi:hypothetical protein